MTKRSLLLSCFLLFLSPLAADSPEDLFLSTPEEISTLTADPEYLIGGLVSPMSGHPILRKVDLIAKGAQDVVLQRTYLPFRLLCHAPHCVDDPDGVCKKIEQQQQIAHSYRGWQFYQHLYIHKVRTKQGTYVSVPDPSGVVLSFVMQGKGELKLKRLLDCMTNVQGEEPSGRYDLRNTRVFLLDHDHIKVDAPDATTRFYTRRAESFRLEKEVLPNGKVLQFHYDKEDKLKSIRSMDPKERHTYAWIELEGKDRATTSTGLSVDYQYEQRGALQEDLTLPPLLTRVSSPFYRNENLEYCDGFLLGLYRENREFFTPKYTGFGSPAHYRVSSLLFPVGSSDALVPLFDIEYQLAEQESKTTVRHSDGSMTCYFFSKQFLLTRIQYLNPEGRVRKEKRFFWNQDNHLEALELLGEQGRLYRRSYEYDRFGNPIVEYLTGDLTGRGVEETACTRRTFSEDGRNLLLREETEDQKVLYFFYLPGTNLMVKKYINAWDRILLREFREYDEANNLLCIIEDDGHHEDKDDLSGVTQRRITRYILRQHQPFLHRPEWIEESYIDPLHPQEVLFKKTHLHYDAWGNVVQEEVLGANGSFLYTIHTTYDERGNILSKTNKLGQRAEYQYDDRGRLCSFTPFSHRCHVTYHLDTRGRLVRKEERGDDGLLRTFHTAYDTYDRILQEQDFLGNIITYTYDSFVNQPVRTNFPSVLSMEGQVMPVTTQAVYDAFGRKVKEIDACGNTTQYRYNIYGSPSQITHSDGGIERLYYTKQGVLQTHIDQEGLRVDLEVDVLARITKKIYSSRQHLATESFIYSGFSLLSQQDKEGLITSYLYDGMGRKVQENQGSHRTDLHYDERGYLSSVCKHNHENILYTHYQRDAEGQVIEKSQTDASGRLLTSKTYTYDSDGNKSSITHTVQGKKAQELFFFDSKHRVIWHQDAMGLISTTSYEEGILTPSGQRLLRTKTTSWEGVQKILLEDAKRHLLLQEQRSSQGELLAKQERFYDPESNLLCLQDYVINNPDVDRERIVFGYDTRHRKILEIRAYGTPYERVTSYSYTPSGLLQTKTLPSGLILTYTYSPLGFQESITSSDGMIHHLFTYNKRGDLLSAVDKNSHIFVTRELDPYGNVIKEVSSLGLYVEQEYDAFHRPIALQLSGQGAVHYTYDPLFLRTVTRVSKTRAPLYTYRAHYDASGFMSQEELIGDLGTIIHTADLAGRTTSLHSPYFFAEYHYNSRGNLLSSFTDIGKKSYAYNSQDQLVQEKDNNYAYDSLYNRVRKNNRSYKINSLNEVDSTVDLEGRVCSHQGWTLIYDPLDRLIKASSVSLIIQFDYDPLGRCVRRTAHQKQGISSQELYLHVDHQEIGIFSQDLTPKHLKILGPENIPIAIESQGQIFAPLVDVRNTICRLIDLSTRQEVARYDFTAFGEEVHSTQSINIPWRFASKRLDPDLQLISCGKRYYSPDLARWMSKDPAGFIDSVNPYQYVFNNPFLYTDPEGEFVFAIPLLIWGAELLVPSLTTLITPIVYGALIGGIAYSGYKVVEQLSKDTEYLPTLSCQEQGYVMNRKKEGRIDPSLPTDPLNDPNYEDISHPKAKGKGHHTLKDKRTGEKIRFDEGNPSKLGHGARDHFHKFNPDSKTIKDRYLNEKGEPVSENSEESHLYPPEWAEKWKNTHKKG